jgi:hypothetical protein
MTNPNQTEKDPKSVPTHQDDAAPKAAKPSETKRELTDAEIAAVSGGVKFLGNRPHG